MEQVERVKFNIMHMCARARVYYVLTFVWIIIKNTCSTCSIGEIIKFSPVPPTCSHLFHLFYLQEEM